MGKKKNSDEAGDSGIFPLLALKNYVLTPLIPQPVRIEDEAQKEFIEKAFNINTKVFVVLSEPDEREPGHQKIKSLGVVGIVDRVLQMPGAPSLVFVRPVYRALFQSEVFSPVGPMARVTPLADIKVPRRISAENRLLQEHVKNLFEAVMQFAGDQEKQAAERLIEDNSNNPLEHLYAMAHVAPISPEDKYHLLECNTYSELLHTFAILLDETEQKISLQASIHEKTHHELNRQQKEAFLRMHLKHIREELGEGEENEDVAELIAKAQTKKWTKETAKHFDKELQKLRRLNVNSPEYSVQYGYLEEFLELPWGNYNHKKISLDKVEEVLNRDHYGLESVKERILEYMAVVTLRNDLKAPILCLYGPPGVGKTSIGKSVAEATGREYARIALGGMHDESEIRGHRRTYIGAMPGRFLHSLSKLKYGNPLILLDEIDKVGKDFKGDPSSALLEALDPEQNNTFHDNFIDYPYDLSKVLFIATANDLTTIPAPLKDRMEIIEMHRYSMEEKREIALRHLVDKALSDNGFKKGDLKFTPEAINAIIRRYTHEAGVRQLAKKISAIIRKLALMKVRGKEIPSEITEELALKFLGSKKDASFSGLGFQA